MSMQHLQPSDNRISRRQFLRLLGWAAGAGIVSACTPRMSAPPSSTGMSGTSTPTQTILPLPTNTASVSRGEEGERYDDVVMALRSHADQVAIVPGAMTRVWRYSAEVLEGDPSHVTPLPGYLGPVLRFQRGQRLRVEYTNELPEESIVHWHGLHVPPEMDGHPRFAIGQGQTYTYTFEIRNRAGTYWYHPHPHGRTGPQVYWGMAGFFIVHDEEEATAGLPDGEYDLPLVIQDRTFDANNQLIYLTGGMGGMGGGQMLGFLGDTILVNGRPNAIIPVATRPYRLRLLNGSNSRIYKLAWSDGRPLTVIGTDGGLLERPVERAYVTLAPAERIELWVDFGTLSLGSELVLLSLPFTGQMGPMSSSGMGPGMGMGNGMGRGNMGPGTSPGTGPNTQAGESFSVVRFRVEREERSDQRLPSRLSSFERLDPANAVNKESPRRFVLHMQQMSWRINGRTFQMTAVADDERVRRNTVEIWEFENRSSGGMGMGGMALPHPMHVHDVQFQVLKRELIEPSMRSMWEELQAGFVNEGWKDTVLVMPGERVTLLVPFGDYAGMYLYHCHNLEHEDMGMMRNYLVEA